MTGLPVGIIALDLNGGTVLCNAAAKNLIGLKQEKVPLNNWFDFYRIKFEPLKDQTSDTSPFDGILSGNQPATREALIESESDPGKSNWCTIDLSRFEDESGDLAGIVLLIQNNNERKRLADEVARSNEALQQFATVAAHDLQEPLRSIRGFADMLSQYQANKLDEKSERCVTKIKDGISRMQILINDLLGYSRIQTKPQTLKAVNCGETIQSCIRSLDDAITNSGARIEFANLPIVLGDSSQLSQLFQNLLGNAIKFAAAGRSPVVRITATRQSNLWLFSVEDNGIGIAEEFRERVFRVFQRLHTTKAYAGTGIGLAICQTIVHRHGGTIWVESQPGEGSIFYFTLANADNTK